MKYVTSMVGIFAVSLIATTAFAVPAPIAAVDATPTYSSVTVGGVTVGSLVTGTTATFDSNGDPTDFSGTIDVLDLDFGVSGGFLVTSGDYTTTDFGGSTFITDNDSDPDFFIFEDTGNDNFTVQAILVDQTLGDPVSVLSTDFGPVLYSSGTLNNNGNILTNRNVAGVSLSFTDLLDGSGSPLAAGAPIRGIFIDSNATLDVYSISANVEATVPEPSTFVLGFLALCCCRIRNRGFVQ